MMNPVRMTVAAALIGTTLCVLLASQAVWALDEGAGRAFVGNKTCKKCHLKQYKSWEKTKMAKTFDVLKPDERTDKKASAELDPAKDYTTDAECLKCHTVGFGTATGYQVPPTDDKKAQRRAAKLVGVGCESCHGPGSEYVKLHKKIQDESSDYTWEEMAAAGMFKIEPEVCATCHNTDSPFVGSDYVFDYEERKEEGTHEHFGLQHRKD